MNDDQVREYLRGRGRAEPPLDFIASVMDAVAHTPRRHASWFAPFTPAAAAVGAAAAVMVLAILISQGPNMGPPPGPSGSVSESAPATVVPTPTPTPAPTANPPTGDMNLLAAGDTAIVAVQSDDGVTGTIRLERGADVGGYPLVVDPGSESHFFVEIFATYELDSVTEEGQWGELDWRVESWDGAVRSQVLNSFPMPEGRAPLGHWPGATVPENMYRGWMIFAIPREDANTPLELVYQPDGMTETARLSLRAPGQAPQAIEAEWPRPDPVYIARDGLPFTVLDNPEADALFTDADTCTNPDGGYTVAFPESWYTNTEIGDVPACSWFSPVFYEATEGGPVPNEIAIRISVIEGAIGFIWVDLYTEEVMLDGYPARRYETGMTKDVATPTDQFQYSYLASLDEDSEGRKLWAFTGTDYGGDYALNKAVFDRIMASLEFID